MLARLVVALGLVWGSSAMPAAAVTYHPYCESAGMADFGGVTYQSNGHCTPGDTETGTDILTFDMGSIFRNSDQHMMRGWGAPGDADVWLVDIRAKFKVWLDLAAYSGDGPHTGALNVTFSDGVQQHLVHAGVTGPVLLWINQPGVYRFSVSASAVLPGDIYNYDLRLETIPLPAGGLLLASALGLLFLGQRRGMGPALRAARG